jgi:5-methylcytosine-specific restriction endonuclease McrA
MAKITLKGKLIKENDGTFGIPIAIGQGRSARIIKLNCNYNPAEEQPTQLISEGETLNGFWAFCDQVVEVKNSELEERAAVIMKVKHAVLRHEKQMTRIAREVEAYENLELIPNAQRERLPDSVKLFVWQRDQGKCVKCGCNKRLEFDHIIPVALGGSNTERNIQLLCEICNREKGKNM